MKKKSPSKKPAAKGKPKAAPKTEAHKTKPVPAENIERATKLLMKLVATPRVSREEGKAADLLERALKDLKLPHKRFRNNLVVTIERGAGPTLMLCTHIDTVPPSAGYTRDPYATALEGDKLYGLGSNDAGAAVVSMIEATALIAARKDWRGTLVLALVAEEEVSGQNGLETLLKDLGMPTAAIVGEPTGLDVCVAQKGLVVIDCTNFGQSCHAANAFHVPHKNAILEAGKDIPRVYDVRFNARDEAMSPTSLHVTVIQGGTVHNSIPDRCTWKIDARVNPAQALEEVVSAVRAVVSARVEPRSLRLQPFKTPLDADIVRAARAARPAAKTFGSDTMSDATFLRSIPVVKCGPGVTEMSHKPNEYVELRWIGEGIAFYRDAMTEYFKR